MYDTWYMILNILGGCQSLSVENKFSPQGHIFYVYYLNINGPYHIGNPMKTEILQISNSKWSGNS